MTKESEGIPNQGNPELTRKPIQTTLESGIIFMIEPGGEGPTDHPVEHVEATTDASAARPTRRRRALATPPAVVSHRVGHDIRFKTDPSTQQLLSIELSDPTPEALAEARARALQMFGDTGIGLTPKGLRAHQEIIAAFEKNPLDFAKTVAKVIDRLDEEEARVLVERDFPVLKEAVLREIESLPDGEKKSKLIRKFQGLDIKDPVEQARALRSLSTSIRSERSRLTRESEASAPADAVTAEPVVEAEPVIEPVFPADPAILEAEYNALIPEGTLGPGRAVLQAFFQNKIDQGISPDQLTDEDREWIRTTSGLRMVDEVVSGDSGNGGVGEDAPEDGSSDELGVAPKANEVVGRALTPAEQLTEIKRMVGGLKPNKRSKYIHKLAGLSELPVAEQIKTLQKLYDKLHQKEQSRSPEREFDEDEPLTAQEAIFEIRTALKELGSKTLRAHYHRALESIPDLPTAEEKRARLIEILNAIRTQSQDVDTLVHATIEAGEGKKGRETREGMTQEEYIEKSNDLQAISISEAVRRIMDKVGGFNGDPENDTNVVGELLFDTDLMGMLGAISKGDHAKFIKARDKLKEIMESSRLSPEEKKERLAERISSMSRKYEKDQRKYEKDQYNPIESVQDLGREIAKRSGEKRWGAEGIYPIIDKEGAFHQENMVRWVREQTIKMHTDNRSDAISPLGSIHVRIGIGDVSLYEMVRINRQVYMKDAVSGRVLDDLAEELIQESWGFGQIRNADLAYRQAMNEDKRLPEVINQIHARSDLTHGSLLRDFLKMSDEYGEQGDIVVGDAVLLANDIYYNLSDWETLVTVVGGEQAENIGFSDTMEVIRQRATAELKGLKGDKRKAVIERYQAEMQELAKSITTFTRGDFEDAIRLIQRKKDWEAIDSFEGFYDSSHPGDFYYVEFDGKKGKETKVSLFDREGRFDIIAFSKGLNFYNDANPDLSKYELVRELIKLKIAEKTGLAAGIERTAQGKEAQRQAWQKEKERETADNITISESDATAAANATFNEARYMHRVNLEFAENLAEAFQRPYGGAARNDVNRRGYDAMTKLWLEDYLVRQSAAGRAGPVGVREAVGIYRNVGPDMWAALKTETKMTPLEIFGLVRAIRNTSYEDLYDSFKENGLLIELVSKDDKEKLMHDISGLSQAEQSNVVEQFIKDKISAEIDAADQKINLARVRKSIAEQLKELTPDQQMIMAEETLQEWLRIAQDPGASPEDRERVYKTSVADKERMIAKKLQHRVTSNIKTKEIDKLKFASGAEKDVAGNIESRGFQMFHAQTGGDRVDLDKLVSWDTFQGVKIHLGEWEEKISDGIIKPARYMGSTNGGMKFSSQVRRYDPTASAEFNMPIYETMSLAEATYSPRVMELMRKHLASKFNVDPNNIDFRNFENIMNNKGNNVASEIQKYIDYGEGRLMMVKYGLALDLGAQLKHHRAFRSHAHRWGFVRTEAFMAALEEMQEIESDPENPGKTRPKLDSHGHHVAFFNEELLELIREEGNSKKLKLIFDDTASETIGPILSAIIEVITKSAAASLQAA